MSEDEIVSFSLEVNVEPAYKSVRKLQTVAYRALGLVRRLARATGSDTIDEAIGKAQQFIAWLNQARLAAIAFYAASGPLGWALAAIGFAATMVTFADMVEYDMRG